MTAGTRDAPHSAATPPSALIAHGHAFRWRAGGDEAFAAMLAAIGNARESVELEFYICKPGAVVDSFLRVLLEARARGVRVRLLLDAFGALPTSGDTWRPLQAAGGEVRWFNPVSILRWSFRNHCKLVLADDSGVVGGMNLADEQLGDGVAMGWRDLALELRGPTVATMREEFDRMWLLAAFDVRSIRAYWRGAAPASSGGPVQALMTGPGHSGTGLVRRAYADLREARSVSAHAPYFLPSRRLRGLLRQVARRGRVRILVGATSDVPLARLATLRAMRKMDGSDVEFFDYRPQVLHSKLLVIDDIVYVGSANLDARSRLINFELMLRVESSYVAAQARDLFDEDLRHAVSSVRAPPTAWQRLREEAAHWLLARLDPYLALRALRSMR